MGKIIDAIRRMTAAGSFSNTGYSHGGASVTKHALKGWTYESLTAREDINYNLPVLRQRSRDLYMTGATASGALKKMRTNVIGQGLRLNSQIDADFLGISPERKAAIERQIEREFELWAGSPNCDAARNDNFYELQQLAFLNMLMSGDLFAVLPYKKRPGSPYELCVALVEADRVQNPPKKEESDTLCSGVHTDKQGETLGYYVLKRPSTAGTPGYFNPPTDDDYKYIPAFDPKTGQRHILHVMHRERIGQTRGVPFLSPVILLLKQLERYTDAELAAAVVSGFFTVFIEKDPEHTNDPFGEMKPIGMPDEESSFVSNEPPMHKDDIALGNGAIVDLAPGEKAVSATPGRPNSEFTAFVNAVITQIAGALEIPPEVLRGVFNSNYSASRAAILEAWRTFKMWRAWFVADFCQAIYEEWLCEAVARGRVQAPGFFDDPAIRAAYCRATWNGPTQGQIDPLKEVNAAILRMNSGLSTGQQETTELSGGDYIENLRQRAAEIAAGAGVIEPVGADEDEDEE